MKIEVKRITGADLFQEVASMTTGKPCKMSWLKALKSGHSIIRAQMYLIKLYDIPQFVMGHLVRHIHAQPYVLSKRTDRGGVDFRFVCNDYARKIVHLCETPNPLDAMDKIAFMTKCLTMAERIEKLPEQFDRYAPTSMALLVNAEEIINISKARLCNKASLETRSIWREVLTELEKIDPDIVKLCQRPCVLTGVCREIKPCGFLDTQEYEARRKEYTDLFK